LTLAKSPTEQIRELSTDVSVLEARVDTLLDEMKDRKAGDEKRREEITLIQREEIPELRQELPVSRQENAVLRQQLQDHISQYQE
jgi:hypothetical protein